MKDLKECQAEVFRRSTQKIKAQKQRRTRILLTCIPAVLCVAALVAFFPHPGAPELGAPEIGPDAVTELVAESNAYPVSKITVSGPAFSRAYADAAQIRAITDCLEACILNSLSGSIVSSGSGSDTRAESTDDFTETSTDASAPTGYTISLIPPEGDRTVYHLAGNTLTNHATGQIHILTDRQAAQLESLLGIPQQ